MSKSYHTYDVAALEKNLQQCNVNIKTYEDIIVQEHKQKAELMKLIAEGQERDALMGTD